MLQQSDTKESLLMSQQDTIEYAVSSNTNDLEKVLDSHMSPHGKRVKSILKKTASEYSDENGSSPLKISPSKKVSINEQRNTVKVIEEFKEPPDNVPVGIVFMVISGLCYSFSSIVAVYLYMWYPDLDPMLLILTRH